MKTQLRKTIRQQRRKIPNSQKTLYGQQLAQICMDHDWIKKSLYIACYLDNDGEIETRVLIHKLHKAGKSVYLPILHPIKAGELQFIEYQPGDQLTRNRFGIREPLLKTQDPLPARELDLVLTPLVAFDRYGNRLGMGGGFYDRTFSFTHTDQKNKPLIAGIAYSFQQLEKLEAASWDVRLGKIFTEQSVVDTE